MAGTELFKLEVQIDVRDFGPVLKYAVNTTALSLRTRSRSDIQSAGNLSRWSKGLTTSVKKISGGYKITSKIKPNFMKVYETGGISVGRPILWIPVGKDNSRGRGLRAKRYAMEISKLFQPKGTMVLISRKDRQIKYVGITQVTHPHRLNLAAIAEDEAAKFQNRLIK